MKEKKIKVGVFNPGFNELLGITLTGLPIYRSKGLQAHMMKQKHFKAVEYIDRIPEILNSPDYIGSATRDDDTKIEYVKCFEDNIILCVKISPDKRYMYVATMFDIPQKKIDRFVYSGRIKRVIDCSSIK